MFYPARIKRETKCKKRSNERCYAFCIWKVRMPSKKKSGRRLKIIFISRKCRAFS